MVIEFEEIRINEVLFLLNKNINDLITEVGEKMGYTKVGEKKESGPNQKKDNVWQFREKPVIEGYYSESGEFTNQWNKKAWFHKIFVDKKEILVFGNRDLDFLILEEDGGFKEGDKIKIEYKGKENGSGKHLFDVFCERLIPEQAKV